jgi:hypothetical protein
LHRCKGLPNRKLILQGIYQLVVNPSPVRRLDPCSDSRYNIPFADAELQRIGAISNIRTQLLKGPSISNFSTWTPRTPLLPSKVAIPISAHSNSSPHTPSSSPPDHPSPSPNPASPPPSPPKLNDSSLKKTSTYPMTSPLASPTIKSATLPTSTLERRGGPQISLPPPSNGSTSTTNSHGGPA